MRSGATRQSGSVRHTGYLQCINALLIPFRSAVVHNSQFVHLKFAVSVYEE